MKLLELNELIKDNNFSMKANYTWPNSSKHRQKKMLISSYFPTR